MTERQDRAKALLDEMYAPTLARELRGRGHDVLAVGDLGMTGADDRSLFEAAQREARIVVTENVSDYLDLDVLYRSMGRAHSGLILVHPETFDRHGRSFPGDFVVAMHKLMLSLRGKRPVSSRIHWLQHGRRCLRDL